MPNNNITDFTVEELVAQLQVLTSQQTESAPQTNTVSTPVAAPVAPAVVMGRPWARKSRFYNTIMSDGFIYNPFLHRRFLPVQFLRMVAHNSNVIGQIKSNYSYNYSIKWLKEEVRKLALLEKTDPIGFEERKQFLSVAQIRKILIDYSRDIKKVVKTISANDRIDKDSQIFKYLKGRGWVMIGKKVLKVSQDGTKVEEFISPSKDGNKLIYDLERLEGFDINSTYTDINSLFTTFKWIELSDSTEKSKTWVECFYAQGAYYTIKHLIITQGLRFKSLSGHDAAVLLKQHTNEKAYILYAMLKECIEDNNYTIPSGYTSRY